jgi:AmmeMemoRadiSam system protein B
MVRTPAVAGQFYEGSRAGLHSQVERYVEADAEKEEVKAVLSPHAGLMYSGPVAGAVYSRIKFPHTFVLLGPNHTGMGPRIAMAGEGIWEIPTAALSIDEGLSASIAEKCPVITRDTLAHRYEHSLEVQLPFIAHFSTDVKIVPISVMQATVDELISVGEGIAEAVKGVGYSVVIVASSDMSHFIPDELAREKDKLAIDKVLATRPRPRSAATTAAWWATPECWLSRGNFYLLVRVKIFPCSRINALIPALPWPRTTPSC